MPDALVKEVKLRALHEGRKLKDIVAELLRKGLAAPTATDAGPNRSLLTRDKKSLLPLIVCRHAAAADKELSPEVVANILNQQEASWHAETR